MPRSFSGDFHRVSDRLSLSRFCNVARVFVAMRATARRNLRFYEAGFVAEIWPTEIMPRCDNSECLVHLLVRCLHKTFLSSHFVSLCSSIALVRDNWELNETYVMFNPAFFVSRVKYRCELVDRDCPVIRLSSRVRAHRLFPSESTGKPRRDIITYQRDAIPNTVTL